MADRTPPPGHSRAAHRVLGWCAACPHREPWEELVAWRAHEYTTNPPSEEGSETVVPCVTEQADDWCPHCRKETLATASITAMLPTGVARIGGYALCRECGWSPNQEAGRG